MTAWLGRWKRMFPVALGAVLLALNVAACTVDRSGLRQLTARDAAQADSSRLDASFDGAVDAALDARPDVRADSGPGEAGPGDASTDGPGTEGGSADAGADGASRDGGLDAGGGPDAAAPDGGCPVGELECPDCTYTEGCPGEVVCENEDCSLTCEMDRTCALAGSGFNTFFLTCRPGAHCSIDATEANNVDQIVCESGSTCDIHCTDVNNCKVTCQGSASCLLDCMSVASCEFDECAAPEDCGGGVTVCNRTCPS